MNDVLRFLTAFSVVILPLTLIASVFGMNVPVPAQQGAHAFWIIIVVMFGMVVAVAAFFRRRGWL